MPPGGGRCADRARGWHPAGAPVGTRGIAGHRAGRAQRRSRRGVHRRGRRRWPTHTAARRGFWTAIIWLVLLSTIGGYGSFLFVVRRAGATRASTLLYLTPPTTAVWAWLLLDQTPGPLAVPGVLVCAAGVALAIGRTRRSTSSVPPEALPTGHAR